LFEQDPDAFDIVVTDYTMPQLTGEDLARRITALRSDIPIIIVTGTVSDFPPQRVAKAGVKLVVAKPLTGAELGESIRTVLDKHSPAPSAGIQD
jgi:CheY-like chemotaxis protein